MLSQSASDLLRSNFLLKRCSPSSYVPAHNTLKVMPPVLNYFNIVQHSTKKLLNFKYSVSMKPVIQRTNQ